MVSAGARRAIKLGGLLAFSAGGEGLAQVSAPTEGDLAVASAPANGVIAYPPSFFTEFRPSTAQDMIGRPSRGGAPRGAMTSAVETVGRSCMSEET